MEENTLRGKRTLFWMKVCLVLGILTAILCGAMYLGYGEIFQMENPTPDSFQGGFGFLALVLFILLFGFVGSIAVSVEALFWLLWTYRAVKNLRVLTTTQFSPVVAVLLGVVPYIAVLHFFVFRDLVAKQQGELVRRGIGFTLVPQNLVNGWALLCLVGIVAALTSESVAVLTFGAICGFASYIAYMKAFAIYIEGEHRLFEAYKDEEFRKKVDQVLREREIEKAAAAEP